MKRNKSWEMTNHMTRTDLASFAEVLRAKQVELSRSGRGLDSIVIERSADVLEEAQYKSARELAIAGLNRESSVRRGVAMALVRIQDGTFGACVHCSDDISRRRLDAVPWTPLCIRCQEAADRGEEGILETIEQPFLDAA
jgi:DnaK suppressor protein